MNKHTNGSWTIKAQPNTECSVFSGRDTDTAYFLETAGYQDVAEQQANCVLMQSAPDLLDACKLALQRLKELQDATGYPTAHPQILLENAIKRAGGTYEE